MHTGYMFYRIPGRTLFFSIEQDNCRMLFFSLRVPHAFIVMATLSVSRIESKKFGPL